MIAESSGSWDPARRENWVTLARLTRTWGNRGELAAVPLSSHTERFGQLREVLLRPAEGSPRAPRRVTVERVRRQGGRLIFKFEGVDSIAEAESWRGAEVQIPLGERLPPPPDEIYLSDLIGCEVVEQAGGRAIGRVAAWIELPGGILLEVDNGAGGEILVPFAASICREVDLAAGRIVVELPAGLEELNR